MKMAFTWQQLYFFFYGGTFTKVMDVDDFNYDYNYSHRETDPNIFNAFTVIFL